MANKTQPPAVATVPAALRDIRAHLKKADVDEALGVLRDGMAATRTVVTTARTRSGAKATTMSSEEPDYPTRVACARLILEYGFGKPVVQQRIDLNDGYGDAQESPQAIADRIKNGGVDMRAVLDVYANGLAEAEPVFEDDV
jgi:hypothetical protein